MPPNHGGFFMVRSYYPSECHADYFDFERIEALKPAIEACGISTLSQSPMLGFHKQMDNRINLLEESLSFRMQGVEFDNGDMYADGQKAASDVRVLSSTRRHTIFDCDWSSDVCSSDLKIFDLMQQFAGYGFNKSHSAAYAYLAYVAAFLKTHYSVEFMSALLASESGNTDKIVKYINEDRKSVV